MKKQPNILHNTVLGSGEIVQITAIYIMTMQQLEFIQRHTVKILQFI